MAADITKIPLSELLDDLVESARDAERCRNYLRLSNGVLGDSKEYQSRRDSNEGFIKVISAEIVRRVEEKNGKGP